MEQLVFLLIFAVIGFINWLVQKSAEQREAAKRAAKGEENVPRSPSPWQAPRPVAGPLTGDMGDAARRLREALGLPADAETPRPVERRAEPPVLPEDPAPVAPAQPPAPRILFERKIQEYEADLERRLVAIPTEEFRPEPVPVRRAAAVPTSPAVKAPHPLEELLRSREGLRQAILAQEVLGTPKGLVF